MKIGIKGTLGLGAVDAPPSQAINVDLSIDLPIEFGQRRLDLHHRMVGELLGLVKAIKTQGPPTVEALDDTIRSVTNFMERQAP